MPQLQRQIAYDRLLERLYLGGDQWIVKGGDRVLARNVGVRATIDVDLYRPPAAQSTEVQQQQPGTVDTEQPQSGD